MDRCADEGMCARLAWWYMFGVAATACSRVVTAWDDAVRGFLAGASPVPQEMRRWADSYRGRGRGEVVWDAFPEPFLGRLGPGLVGVFFALNPGQAHLDFQGRDGVFADEIRTIGSYSGWAATWPYLRSPWVTEKGRNQHHASRFRFLCEWQNNPSLPPSAMAAFELYPWHSTAVTAAMRPNPHDVRRWVWEPVGELGAPVFAFGAPWFAVLEQLGLRAVARLGAGGNDYGSAVPSRAVAVYRDEATNVTVIAERHSGGAGPPSRVETERLRDAVVAYL